METEFWGVEVNSGELLKVSPGNGRVLHLSQASLGDHKHEKGKESVSLYVNVDGKKLVLGTLITNKLPQHLFDLLFDREFELSHDWKSGSVYFYGYKASNSSGEDESLDGESDESDYEENILLDFANNGKRKSNAKQENPLGKVEQQKPESNAEQENPLGKVQQQKPESNAEQENPLGKVEQQKPESNAKQEKLEANAEQQNPESKAMQEKPVDAKRSDAPNERSDAARDLVKIVETNKVVNPQVDDESSYEDLMSEDDGEDNSQVETSKKRPVESATETPDPNKKAKVASQETGSNTRELLPANDAAKNTEYVIVNRPKPKPYPCNICKKYFGTLQGVESHTKDKHRDKQLS